jgi:adenylate kinase
MIADWLKPKIPVISTGDMLRAEIAGGTTLGNHVKGIVAAGGLVSDALVNQILESRISQPDCANGFMLDGYPRTIEQAEFLGCLLKSKGLPEPVVIHLDVPADVLVGRMICRRQCTKCSAQYNILSKRPKKPGRCDVCGAELIVRKDDREDVIRERLHGYDELTRPVLGYYYNGHYFQIAGDRSPVYIFEEITSVLEPFQETQS